MTVELHGLKETEQFLRSLSSSTKQALSNTLTDLAELGKAEATTSVLSQLNLTKAYVNDKFDITKSNNNSLTAKIRTEKRGLSLASFNAKQLFKGKRRSGVSVNVNRKAKKIPKGFMLTGKNNNKLIAIRQGKGRNNFKVLYGPSVSQVFTNFHDPITKKITDNFGNRFEQQLSRMLNEQI